MADNQFLTYKGRPLVRQGDTIYYGSSAEKYVIMLRILSEKKVGKEKVADKVSVQLLSTDTSLSPEKRVLKTSEKPGIYDALDIGAVWLDLQLQEG